MKKITQLANNQLTYTDGDKRVFQSYNTIIAVIENGKTFLDETSWNYSKTTAKWRNIFLNMTTEETKKAIKEGDTTLKDLN